MASSHPPPPSSPTGQFLSHQAKIASLLLKDVNVRLDIGQHTADYLPSDGQNNQTSVSATTPPQLPTTSRSQKPILHHAHPSQDASAKRKLEQAEIPLDDMSDQGQISLEERSSYGLVTESSSAVYTIPFWGNP